MRRNILGIFVDQLRRVGTFIATTIREFPSYLQTFSAEFVSFCAFFHTYLRSKLLVFSSVFESNKNVIVKGVLIKRGKRNRIFLHMTAMVLLMLGAVISPFISDALFSEESELTLTADAFDREYSLASDDVFETRASEKPRDEVLSYTVQKGDTISTIAEKFGISEETIRWENSIKGDQITVGDEIRILPVTGVLHKVSSGDTVYTIADKYDTNPQAIVDFPFNDFADPQTFALVAGQNLVVPDGVPPSAPVQSVPRRQYIATGPVNISGGGFTWPLSGSINQYYAWYHRAIDIGANVGAPVVSSQDGVVQAAYTSGWHGGYGIHVIVAGDNGNSTLYAHLSGLNVSSGQRVSAGGTVLGWVGMTGRTTGPHLHFEVRRSDGLINPLSVLN